MQFHFQLQVLLHIRELREQQLRRQVEESMSHIHALERSLQDARQWKERTARILASKNFLPACELQFAESALHQADSAIAQCERSKAAEEQHAADLRARYLNARKERKVLSTLRASELRQFEIEQARREQQELDETFLRKFVAGGDASGNLASGEIEANS